MHIDEMTGSLFAHESRMNRYDDTPWENAFKYQLNITRGRGRGGRSVVHSDSKNDSKNEGQRNCW